jgi:hypothetical protein
MLLKCKCDGHIAVKKSARLGALHSSPRDTQPCEHCRLATLVSIANCNLSFARLIRSGIRRFRRPACCPKFPAIPSPIAMAQAATAPLLHIPAEVPDVRTVSCKHMSKIQYDGKIWMSGEHTDQANRTNASTKRTEDSILVYEKCIAMH